MRIASSRGGSSGGGSWADATADHVSATTFVIRHTELDAVDPIIRLVLVDALLSDMLTFEMILREVPLRHRGLVHALGISRAEELRRGELCADCGRFGGDCPRGPHS